MDSGGSGLRPSVRLQVSAALKHLPVAFDVVEKEMVVRSGVSEGQLSALRSALKAQVGYDSPAPESGDFIEAEVEKAEEKPGYFPYMSSVFSAEDKAKKEQAERAAYKARMARLEARKAEWESWLVGAYEHVEAVQSSAFHEFFDDGDGEAVEGLYGVAAGDSGGGGDAAIARKARTRRLVAEANGVAVSREREALKRQLREREAEIAALLGDSELKSAKG